jgi:hypothetical protein
MVKVHNKLIVGMHGKSWKGPYIAACKEPCHRQALGYTTKAAPIDSSEYLWCYRGSGLILNLVDGTDPKWISSAMVEEALSFIDKSTDPVFLFCNQGESRSPTIALMWLVSRGHIIEKSFNDAETAFKKLYPSYKPKDGIRLFAKSYLGW